MHFLFPYIIQNRNVFYLPCKTQALFVKIIPLAVFIFKHQMFQYKSTGACCTETYFKTIISFYMLPVYLVIKRMQVILLYKENSTEKAFQCQLPQQLTQIKPPASYRFFSSFHNQMPSQKFTYIKFPPKIHSEMFKFN